MPYARSRDTGAVWRNAREILLWVGVSHDLNGLPAAERAELSAALDELFDEGVEERRAYYQARMEYLDGAFAELGLEPRVARDFRSRSVRSLPLPPGVDYGELHDRMKDAGYVIYAGLGDAAKTTFRVCALGALRIEALEGFIGTLEQTLNELATPAGVAS